jgi:hypothetical protein
MTLLPEVNTHSFYIIARHMYHLLLNLWKESYNISASTSVDVQQWRPTPRIISPLLCCKVSLAVWRRNHNRADSYRVSIVDVPVSPTASDGMQGLILLTLSWISLAAADGRYWNIRHTQPIWICAITISSPKWKNQCEGRVTTQERKDYSCCRAITAGHQQKWTRWYCTTPSTHLAEVVHVGGD